MNERIWLLKRCDLFERLTPEQSRRLERRACMRRFRKGEIIYFPTDAAETVLVVAEGHVVLKDISADGKEAILAFVEEGELFGELALLDAARRDEYAEAAEDAQVLAVPRDDLLWLFEQRPDTALRVTKLVALRRRRIENRLRSLLFHSSRDRITSLLLELLDSYGERNGQGWEIRLRLSHQELANLIGATRETVTVILGHLQLERLVKVRRRRITVLDREGLTAQVNGLHNSALNGAPRPVRPRPMAAVSANC